MKKLFRAIRRMLCSHELTSDTQLSIVVCKKCRSIWVYDTEDLEGQLSEYL